MSNANHQAVKQLGRRLVCYGFALIGFSYAYADPTVGDTVLLGPFTGIEAELHPANLSPHRANYYGTDLGFSYAHDGKLHFLFGDTIYMAEGKVLRAGDGPHDDIFATIDLAAWPDPTLINSLNMPLLNLGQQADSRDLIGINPGHVMDSLKAPVAAWSNGEREFAVLLLTKPEGCTSNAECPHGLSCDTGLGYTGVPYFEEPGLTLGCVEGRPQCAADTMVSPDGTPVPDSGLCVDTSSSSSGNYADGRVGGVAMKQRIGLRDQTNPGIYTSISEWLTTKFVNTTVRPVTAFEPAAGSGQHNQGYTPPKYSDKGADNDNKLLLWGRPGFIGVRKQNRSLHLYFAYTDMPRAPDFNWQLHYFTGVDSTGKPQFSLDERAAAGLDLDAISAGVQPDDAVDLIQHMSIAWLEELNKWVMFYGGGIDITPLPARGWNTCGLLEIFVTSGCTDVNIGDGSVYLRMADNPWGPWSAPQGIIAGGNPDIPGSGQYGIGGVLRHPGCTVEGCAPHSDSDGLREQGYGWFYGANIIEQWTRPAGDGVDVIWNASTWDPYRVVLYRTRINR